MKRFFTLFLGLAALVALCPAHAAYPAPVRTLTCSSAQGDVTFNIGYFTFGATYNVNSNEAFGGAGRGGLQPLEVHVPLSTFATLLRPAVEGRHFESCTLTTPLADGSTATFVFKQAVIKGYLATGTSDPPAQYIDVQFGYESMMTAAPPRSSAQPGSLPSAPARQIKQSPRTAP